jgi:hypothetical protein
VFADDRFSCNTEKLQNATPLIENMIDRILTIGKIRQKYHICRIPNYSNAVAMIYKKKRIIAYDPIFLSRLAQQSGELHWGKVTALAHEIGHHIHRHTDRLAGLQKLPTTKRLAIQRQYELQADQFAGKVLANIGASLRSTQALIRILKVHQNMSLSDHPDANKRVVAVTQGWNIGCKEAGSECNILIKPRITRVNLESPLGRNATPNYNLFMQQAEDLKGMAVNQSYCNLYAYLAVQQTNRSQQHHCGFNIGSYGSPWNKTVKPQANWCMNASAYATFREAKFRETKLASCIARNKQPTQYHTTAHRKTTANYVRFIQQSRQFNGLRVNRAYCNVYAALAAQQTRHNKQQRCGFEIDDRVNRWSTVLTPQSDWCMTMRADITAGEATFRENKLDACVR